MSNFRNRNKTFLVQLTKTSQSFITSNPLESRLRIQYLEIDWGNQKNFSQVHQSLQRTSNISQPPVRFKITIRTNDNIYAGDDLFIVLMFLKAKVLLHVVDTAIRFFAQKILDP